MNRTNQTIRYLTKTVKWVTIVGVLVILFTVISTDYIFWRTGGFDLGRSVVKQTMPIEMTCGVFALFTGIMYLRPNFRVALANGISRKTFMLANLPVAAFTAAVYALAGFVIVSVHNLFTPINSLVEAFTSDALSKVWILLFQFCLYFMLIIIGWFSTFIYYRSNKFLSWVITLIPVGLIYLYTVLNTHYSGVVYKAIVEAYFWCLRFVGIIPLMIIVSYTFLCFTYLLIDRAPLKD